MTCSLDFVDSIAETPTIRLSLADGATWILNRQETDFSPPPLRRAVAQTLMTDGGVIPSSAYDLRRITLGLYLSTDAADGTATALQALYRELDRPTNLLRWWEHTTHPVFFRTFRASANSVRRLGTADGRRKKIEVELLAEPFAYGLLETPVSAVTVSTDPAAVSNGCFVDVSGVKGDVEAPAIIRWPASTITNDFHQAMFATRRRGDPSAAPFPIQAESMTQGTDTTTQPNDASMSGAGNNFSRCTFATATMQTRLSVSTVGTASVDLRGRYRVLLRYRRSSPTGSINAQLRWGAITSEFVTNAAVSMNITSSTLSTADLGLISIPQGWDPVTGPDGVELSVFNALILQVQVERLSGTSTLDLDFLALVPADDRQTSVAWHSSGVAGLDHYLLNAADNSIHGRDSSGRVISVRAPTPTAGLPMLSPGQTNRIYMLRNIASGQSWALTTVSPVSVSYHPLYLSVRPAST